MSDQAFQDRGECAAESDDESAPSKDGLVRIDGSEMCCITDSDQTPPFLMSIVSDSDLWMYVSSRGGLTAGRIDESRCLFPYETDDKLHCCHGITGPLTILRVPAPDGSPRLWEPFTGRGQRHGVRRNLYKSLVGNRVMFEEINAELGLTFRYCWCNSDEFGFVRTCTLINQSGAPAVDVDFVDGLLNVMPAGVELFTQQALSCLVDAYKLCEIDRETGLAIFSLSSLISDRAEPAEALRANVVWCHGLKQPRMLLCTDQLDAFRAGAAVRAESVLKGRRGNYLVCSSLRLAPHEPVTWDIVADVDRSHAQIERLRSLMLGEDELGRRIRASVETGASALTFNVASADGLQATSDRMATAHHFANVLFNNMRGGVFARNYEVPVQDFAAFVRQRNRPAYQAHQAFLAALDAEINCRDLLRRLEDRGHGDLLRLAYEYLPITFSRRHGDPSRPWNRFAINVKHEDGSRVLNYEGNWRDIFQNWEALCLSFPGFIESIIAKFVNASTIDGFNPYRVTRAGIDWEAPDPAHPWSNIGYWGDHQIIYLLKFLEASRRFHPGILEGMLDKPLYAYADVPYRLKPYEAILQNSRETIVFDADRAAAIERRVREMGGDGKLLLHGDGRVCHVNLLEKLLVPILCKLSNLVVDGGIWMNTQRPEWNDANNALAGSGISMVTHCYLRRHVAFCADLLEALADREIAVSSEVVEWLGRIRSVLLEHRPLLGRPALADADRKRILDALGAAFSDYRVRVYRNGFSGKTAIRVSDVLGLFHVALEYLDHGIRASRRADGLYHAYNLLDLSPNGKEASIGRLHEMLEGQVAVLSAGLIEAEEAADLLDALFASRMYRPDQRSFMLYPERALPGFLQKNIVPQQAVEGNPLLAALIQAGDRSVIARDAFGRYRFSSRFRNRKDLQEALDALAQQERSSALVAAHQRSVQEVYEAVFNHRAFTGRSGTMFGYEGIGCIYWHMVAKLLVAVQESFHRAVRQRRSDAILRRLGEAYYRVRGGLSFNKSAREYGAFPTDPYSHTPRHAGARQPGLTGQVKEEIITRLGELGAMVEGGQVTFSPILLRRRELLQHDGEWTCCDIHGRMERILLHPDSVAFTFCQVPVVYQRTAHEWRVTVVRADGTETVSPGNCLDAAASAALFNRTGQIRRIEVSIPDSAFLLD